MKQRIANILFVIIVLFTTFTVQAQAPVDSPEQAITGLLNRIGGNGAADKFKFVIDPSLAQNGKDVFVITAQDGKPCIKGNNQLSVATGINWYLNHYAHINLSWSNPKTDLVSASLPVPNGEETHVCNTTYRYNLHTNAFSNSMALWTWDRWQQEIDWMALHGVNAPLNIVGLEVVTRNFLTSLGVDDWDIDTYITGPAYLSWFANNQIQGLGSTAWAEGVTMNGIPDWWYTRQEELCKQMLTRMREFGMQPVLPGFSGQVPDEFINENVNTEHILDNGIWLNEVHKRPDIVKPGTGSYNNLAKIYYKELHNVMGISELYSIDPFHDGSLPNGVTSTECYPGIMTQLDDYYNKVSTDDKTKYSALANKPKWFIHYHNDMPQSEAFKAMKDYGDRFIALDINADIANNSMWNNDAYNDYPYIFCMLNDFGGRNGMHGRLESTMNNYFNAIANDNSILGIGATPEGIETNHIVYDMLFELPWMSTRPNLNEWLKDYAHARYGTDNATALEALQTLKESVWNCTTDQLGASEAVILARPTWNLEKVSEWGTTALYYNPYDVLQSADKLISIREQITEAGKNNYNYDITDIVRQAMVDYAAELLPLINDMRKAGNTAEYRRLYELFLNLMLDLDGMLAYNEFFNLSTWTHRAHEIVEDVNNVNLGDNECNWLECNIRSLITVWAPWADNYMHDYSNRCWAGLIKDYYYKRWAYFFEKRGNNIASNYWYNEIEYPWSTDLGNHKYNSATTPSDMTVAEKVAETFNKTFGRLKSGDNSYLFPMGAVRDAQNSGVIPAARRGETIDIPFEIGKNVLLTSFWIDLNHDGVQSNEEILEVTDNRITIPMNAEVGKAKAIVTYRDGTSITFSFIINANITIAREVAVTANTEEGSAIIESTGETSITNNEAVAILATANSGYNFCGWYDVDGNFVSNKNPYTYYGKEAATFTAHFIEDKWGVVEGDASNIADEGKFVQRITLTRYNRDPETIYETTTAPTEIFTTIPQIINVAQGASFDIAYDNGNRDGLKNCYFRAYIDLNQDGDFDDYGELIHTIGTDGAENAEVCSGNFNVLLPYTIQLGITHIRLRFDDAIDNPTSKGAKDDTNCPVYDIVINVTEYANEAAHINVTTNNKDWGSVKVWDNETSESSNSTELDVAIGAQFTMEAILDEGAEFLGWYDQYDRLVSNNPQQTMYARGNATYTAKIRRILIIDGWHITFRTVEMEEDGQTGVILSKVLQSGNGDLVIPETVKVLDGVCPIVGFDNDLFCRNTDLLSITLPKSLEFVHSITALDASLSGSGTATVGEDIILDIPDLHTDESWIMEIEVTNEQILTGYGTCLIASGENPRLDFYPGGFQLYLVSSEDTDFGVNRNFLVFKADGHGNDDTHFDDVYTQDHFKVTLEYDHTTQIMTARVIKADGTNALTHEGTETLSFTCPNLQTIKTVCTDLAQGVDIQEITITMKELPDPFRGCSNLDAIYVDEENETYLSKDGCLYYAKDESKPISTPAGMGKGDARRKLAEIIKKMEALSAQVATYSNTGGEAREKIALQKTDEMPYPGTKTCHIWTNATDTTGKIEYLYDGITGVNYNYFQASLNNDIEASSNNYIEVYLGNYLPSTKLQYTYHTRSGSKKGFPDGIDAIGYWEFDKYGNLVPEDKKFHLTLHSANNLPQEANKSYTSEVINNPDWYNYIRFYISSNDGFWEMSEFELYFITQNGASVEVFNIFKDVITEEFMLGCFNETFSAKDVYANSIDVSEINKATSTLQKKYGDLLELIEFALPFELTVDDNNPILYNICHKKAGNVITIQHPSKDLGETTHKLGIQQYRKNNTFQAFYFKSHADGIAIYPYNTDGEVFCSNDTSNDSGKVTTATVDDANYAYKYWSVPFVKEENAIRYYNIMTNGTYLNDETGNTESIGFKSDSGDSDGSLFNFVKAKFENDNPRYYQLIDHLYIHPNGTNIYEGKTVGLYNGGKAYREAYLAAEAIKEAGYTSTPEECLKAHEALHKASKNLSLNKASNDKFYLIKSVAEESYCNGQYVHTLYKKTEHGGGGATAFFDHTNLLLCDKMNIHPRPLAIFQFEETEKDSVYRMKNLHTGMYIKSFTGTQMGTKEEAQEVTVAGIADGQVTLRIGDNDMHAQELYGVITKGVAAPDNASAWEIEEQADIKEIYHMLSIGSAGYSSLYLNYPVEIPYGIVAYTAREVIPGWLIMDEIGDGIIPAKTPVVIKGNPGTFKFQYTSETGKDLEGAHEGAGFKFKGTLYDTYIEQEADTKYYVLSMVDGEIGMYRAMINKNEIGESGNTHFLNNANKVYLEVANNSTISMSSFVRFTFGNNTNTYIEYVGEAESTEPVIYDLQGRRITEITKPGLYIIDNKKVFVK
ncbi:MAG: alpha-N-acetylglucosaminidase C-terminal domain-containing protein [Bacteroidaceae bacterium]|nr:alpha-N-acetylglucosaminidase C-terminal domain-containing protein [Bacteroidaceae bacterium]